MASCLAIVVGLPTTPARVAAEHGAGGPIDASCTATTPQVVSRGQPVALRIGTSNRDPGGTLYAATFSASLATNPFFAAGPFYTKTRWGGGGWAEGGIDEVGIPTGPATPLGAGNLAVTVISDATGATVLATCDIALTVIDPSVDSDGDGLTNGEETAGIDGDGDGTIDLALAAAPFGARWDHKDLFVEVDWMTCEVSGSVGCVLASHTDLPDPRQLDVVVASFADAPLANPDGTTGIALHLMLDEALRHLPGLRFDNPDTGPGLDDDFDDLKLGSPSVPCDGFFGTAVERASPNCAAIIAARKQAFRYAIVGHSLYNGTSIVGIGELPGNDLFLTAGEKYPLRWPRGPLFMHELGHTLGLGHGGGDHLHCKPNYISAMNYVYLADIELGRRPLDFSRAALPTLDESRLDEPDGIRGPAGQQALFAVGGQTRSAPAEGPIDWNGDGDRGDLDVVADPDAHDSPDACSDPHFGVAGPGHPGETLVGYDDWAHAALDIGTGGDFGDYVRVTPVDESLTPQDLLDFDDSDGDGVLDGSDNCVATANADQTDRDGDGIGDPCDPDSDPPTISITAPVVGATYTLGAPVIADYACEDEVGGSGVASCVGTVPDGSLLDTGTVGFKTFTVTSSDNAGHQASASVAYRVAYGFGGFLSPVDPEPTLNTARAGRVVPLRWRLVDHVGAPVVDLSSASLAVASLSCALGSTPDAIEEFAAGASGLRNLGDGYYQLNWQTPSSYARSCKTLLLDLGDGAARTALFQFTK